MLLLETHGNFCVPIRMRDIQVCFPFRYFLQPRPTKDRPMPSCATPPGTRLSVTSPLGSLRLNIQYTIDYVFSDYVYMPLRDLLLQSVHTRVRIRFSLFVLLHS